MIIININEDTFQDIEASHEYIREKPVFDLLFSDIFNFMNEAYKWIGGFKSFSGEDDLAKRSYLWYITYDGDSLEDYANNFDINKIYTISVFRKKYGLKLVGLGNNRFSNIKDPFERNIKKKEARYAMMKHIQFIVKHGWAEVSGQLENMFNESVSPGYIIDPEFLLENNVFKGITPDIDGLHYYRPLSHSNPEQLHKIAYGNIRLDR